MPGQDPMLYTEKNIKVVYIFKVVYEVRGIL